MPPRGYSQGARAPLPRHPGARAMLDLVFIAAGLVFFALTVAYGEGCDRL